MDSFATKEGAVSAAGRKARDAMAAATMSSAAKTSTVKKLDGRRLRSVRTKQVIVEAYLALLRDNPHIPTAAEIAARAGYSVRSVFERFPDLHALRVAATDHAMANVQAWVAARPVVGDRRARLTLHVETRGQVCERWLPLWRALSANQGDSLELQARIRLMRQLIARRAEEAYEPELATLSPLERRQTILAIAALIDFESWARMRQMFELTFEEACEVWIGSIDRLLPPTPSIS